MQDHREHASFAFGAFHGDAAAVALNQIAYRSRLNLRIGTFKMTFRPQQQIVQGFLGSVELPDEGRFKLFPCISCENLRIEQFDDGR